MLKTWRPKNGAAKRIQFWRRISGCLSFCAFTLVHSLLRRLLFAALFLPRNRTHFWGCGAVPFWEGREQKRSCKRAHGGHDFIALSSIAEPVFVAWIEQKRISAGSGWRQLQGSCSLQRCLTPELQLRRPHVRGGSFGCGLRALDLGPVMWSLLATVMEQLVVWAVRGTAR